MACLECNAMSSVLCHSFSLRVFLPEMDKLHLDDRQHTLRYPALWLLHSDGCSALDWLSTPAERCAREYGIIILAPDMQHTLCTDMRYGPAYETFVRTELRDLGRKLLPLSEDPALNWIGGVGTGGYGAVKVALKAPELFSAAFSLQGTLDMDALCRKALAGQDPGIPHTVESFKAVFGQTGRPAGSANDLFALDPPAGGLRLRLAAQPGTDAWEQAGRLAGHLGGCACVAELDGEKDCGSWQHSLPDAVRWLVEGGAC